MNEDRRLDKGFNTFKGFNDQHWLQLSLIDTPQTEEDRQCSQMLMATMDELNEKMGKGTVRLGLPKKNAS